MKHKTGSRIVNNIEPKSSSNIRNTICPEKNVDRQMVFSFAILDRNEYFDFSKTCDKWAVVLMNALKELSSKTVGQIINNPGKNLSFHSDINAIGKCPINPPTGISFDELYEIRFSKSTGRIHGKLIENVFYIVWLDPLHNVFPDDRYGGPKKIRMVEEPCCGSLLNEIERLKEYEKLVEEMTGPKQSDDL